MSTRVLYHTFGIRGYQGTAQILVELSFKPRRLVTNFAQSACFIGFMLKNRRLRKRTSF